MFGPDHNPYVYELLDQNADHLHWDTAEAWNEAKKGMSNSTDAAGGGHAHCGMMIYLGDNWPGQYRGRLFTLNMHGRRINQDRLERHGATYTGLHEADMLMSSDPWFRGIELLYGPDGGVYIADWTDIGECHENDGVHRTSGRIFKMSYGEVLERPKELRGAGGLASQSSAQLVKLQLHPNDWYVRQARQVLQYRAAQQKPMQAVHRQLRQMFDQQTDVTRRLRAIWALQVTGGTDRDWLLERLEDENEHVRRWSVQLLVENPEVPARVIEALATRARVDDSGLVLCYLASALQRLPAGQRWPIAEQLVARQEFSSDRVLPMMIWYGIEGAVESDSGSAVSLALAAQQSQVRRYISRRLGEDLEQNLAAVNSLVSALPLLAVEQQRDILAGLDDALQAWTKAPQPENWLKVQTVLAESPDQEVRQLTGQLGVVFGDGRGLEQLLEIVASAEHDSTARQAAIRSLVTARADGLLAVLKGQLGDRDVVVEAVRGIAVLDPENMPQILLEAYGRLRGRGREAIITALATRPAAALVLLEAIEQEKVDPVQVPVYQIRQMQGYQNKELQQLLLKTWPQLRPITADKQQRIGELRERLSVDTLLAADAVNGRLLWDKSCGKCHVLFGRGGKIAPDLTGAQRGSLQYLLENIVDPSATLAESFRMTNLILIDGRAVNGVVLRKTEKTWEIQTPTDVVVVRVSDIDESRSTRLSLMPEGLLDVLSEKQTADLFAYLMSGYSPARD
jgi:putative heme-binding domain-containing protein